MAGEVVSKYLLKWRASHPLIQPLIVGIQGPQGIGKTTLVNKVKEQLSQHNLNTVFYLFIYFLSHKKNCFFFF